MRLSTSIALMAMVVLASVAVWWGGLNQDEGWYLYAANLVAEGKIPYRDFFFTQGPIMPIVYSMVAGVWRSWGILGARIFTMLIGVLGIIFAVALSKRMAPDDRKHEAALMVLLLLGVNLYHLYYLTIPKTYALVSLFVMVAFYLLEVSAAGTLAAGLALAFAAGTRISAGALLIMVGLWLLFTRRWRSLGYFCVGGIVGIAIVFGPFLFDDQSRAGIFAAQAYHAARSGFDITWIVGSLSRLVRWYLPIFILLGMGGFKHGRLLLLCFMSVFIVQMLAPFPYEDYQVPIMGLLAIFAVINFIQTERPKGVLLVFGLTFATAFGSPLLEKWMTNGQDRFWSIKKDMSELSQLREVANEIEAIDPGGKMLFTQDLYLAIETGRRVPDGLEMGPFAMLRDDEWETLIDSAPCKIAALSGYSFAIKPPTCDEREITQQLEFWRRVKRNYELVGQVPHFGQNATMLMILKRK